MSIEVRTKMKVSRRNGAELIMDLLFTPRGSGNRNKVQRVGEAFKVHPKLSPHVKRVVCGSSRLTVHFRSSLQLMVDVDEVVKEFQRRQQEDNSDQLPLFA